MIDVFSRSLIYQQELVTESSAQDDSTEESSQLDMYQTEEDI